VLFSQKHKSKMQKKNGLSIAVIIPCFNEAITISGVIRSIKKNLPQANIYIFDNNSTDRTALIAKKSGAIVRKISNQGKGNVVRKMFSDIEAEIYIMVDGDDTYEISDVNKHIRKLMDEKLDMLVGKRVSSEKKAYRIGHRLGNKLITFTISSIFKNNLEDILSGYRLFSKRFVKSFPAISNGFEIETELTIHAYKLKMACDEVPVEYKARPIGSLSKLSTFKDGFLILFTIVKLFEQEKPFHFFSLISLLSFILSLTISIPIIKQFLLTGLVPKIPSAIICASLIIISCILFLCGIIIRSITQARTEQKYLSYLSIKHPAENL